MMWTELIRGTSSFCSTVCWVALIFMFLCLTVTGVCLLTMFCEEAAQRKHTKRQGILRPWQKLRTEG
jgi:hypothetical protein